MGYPLQRCARGHSCNCTRRGGATQTDLPWLTPAPGRPCGHPLCGHNREVRFPLAWRPERAATTRCSKGRGYPARRKMYPGSQQFLVCRRILAYDAAGNKISLTARTYLSLSPPPVEVTHAMCARTLDCTASCELLFL